MRIIALDIARTIAIVLMVIFHFCYDLKMFSYVDWDVPDGRGWQEFRWAIVTLFFLCLGVSLSLAYSVAINWRKFSIRTGQIALSAAAISIGSYYAVPKNWIFFGVLHFLALSCVLGIAFVRFPKLSVLFGFIVMGVGMLELLPSRWPFYLFFDNLPSYTNDYVAFFPWFGMVLLGIGLGSTDWLKNDPFATLKEHPKLHKPLTLIAWPGQHSLSIYLLHQPILVGILYLASQFI